MQDTDETTESNMSNIEQGEEQENAACIRDLVGLRNTIMSKGASQEVGRALFLAISTLSKRPAYERRAARAHPAFGQAASRVSVEHEKLTT